MKRLATAGLALAVAVCGFAGCAMRPSPPSAKSVADRAIRAIVMDDVGATQQLFASDVRSTITAPSVLVLSNLLRGLGTYDGVNQISAMQHQRYDLEAQFDNGSLLVQLRLAADGALDAFHLTPNLAH